ncbi:MAG TPA: DUF1176 domain-containing protein [Allosphingosinicella sp.]|jgi:hypothetical protein
MLPLLLAFAAAAVSPHPGELKTFTDWTVGCDNGRACRASALIPEEWPEDAVTMTVSRGAEADAPPVIGFAMGEQAAAALGLDGKKLPVRLTSREGTLEVDPRDAAEAIRLLRTAPALQLLAADGKPAGTISLKGASAALLYMDDKQGRVDTVTALARPGGRTAVPAPPALPKVTAVQPGAAPAPKLSAARIAALRKQFGCEVDEVGGPEAADISRIDPRHGLLLLSCGAGAYNYSSVPILIEEPGGAVRTRIAPFDLEPRWWDEQNPMLVNAEWDPESRILGSFAKGRGLGDCGIGQHFAWDGARFRLVEQFEMGECRGSVDYITTWRAEVVRP